MPDVLKTVGRYEILREVGRGGMALVYLARQTDLDRFVALKELAAFHASDAAFAQRFLRESRVAGSLSHPNIVTVHDYFEHDGTPYIAMEYIDRGSLRPYVGSLSPAQIGGVLEGLLAGLAHAEQHGIVHRDLKPENLMVTDDGRVKIADFGIAKATNQLQTGAFLTATGTTVGTPTYMAPEQAMAQEIGPWTDLYSVGCMAFELYTGRVPFSDSEAPMAILLRHVNEPIPPISTIDPSIDEGLSAWVERLVVKEPKERTQNATEAWDDLEEIIIGLQGPRWRRAARLVDRAPQADTPKPLTPAPFEGTEARQGDFESYVADAPAGPATPPPLDAPAGPLQPGPVDVPVGPPTPPPMEPVSEDDFVTFGAGGPAGPAPAEEAAAQPADDALAEPAAAEPAPADEVVAEPAAAVPSPADEARRRAGGRGAGAGGRGGRRAGGRGAVAGGRGTSPSPPPADHDARGPRRAGRPRGDAAAEPTAPEPGAWAVPPDVAAPEAADAGGRRAGAPDGRAPGAADADGCAPAAAGRAGRGLRDLLPAAAAAPAGEGGHARRADRAA